MKKAELRFLGKCVLFCLPIVVVLGLPVLVMWRSGELIPDPDIVARAVSPDPVIAGLILTNPTDYLQMQMTLIDKPMVLVLGSSRVQQIRSDFFNNPETVHTAGQTIGDIRSFHDFLSHIPENRTPKLLIIGVDQRLFDPVYEASQPPDINALLTQPMSATDVLANWSIVYQYFFEGKFTIGDLIRKPSSSVGLLAAASSEGFRNDGSYDPGKDEYQPTALTRGYLADIDAGRTTDFAYSPTVATSSLATLDSFLAECKARHIYVVGFSPPFSPAMYQRLMAHPGKYGYVMDLGADARPLFAKYHFSYFDFTDPATLGLTEVNMQDGLHTTERGSLMMLIAMAQKDNILQSYVDLPRLRRQLAETTVQTNLFGN